MQQSNGKRSRYFSQSHTYQAHQKNFSPCSLTVRPLEDPDDPPQMKLQEQSTYIDDEVIDLACQNDLKALRIQERQRSKSQDISYTILGFLDRKINQIAKKHKQRLMSEDIRPIKQQNNENAQ